MLGHRTRTEHPRTAGRWAPGRHVDRGPESSRYIGITSVPNAGSGGRAGRAGARDACRAAQRAERNVEGAVGEPRAYWNPETVTEGRLPGWNAEHSTCCESR